MHKSEKIIASFDGTNLFMKTDFPENPEAIAVIVHGLCEHQGRYDHLVKQFCESGIGTYRFDHRGHGRSEGEKAHLTDFNELLDDTNVLVDLAIKENPHLPVFLLGHSMGGYTATLYAVKYPDKKLKGIITSGALVNDTKGLITSLPAGMDDLTALPNELGDGVCSVKEVVDWYKIDPHNGKTFTAGLCYSLTKGVTWITQKISEFKYPVLILHGENDGIVSCEDSVYLFKNVSSKDKSLKLYGNLFHEIFNEYVKEEVIGDAITWIENRL